MDHSDLGSVVRTQHVDDVSIQLRPLLVPQLVQLRCTAGGGARRALEGVGLWMDTHGDQPTAVGVGLGLPPHQGGGDFDVALTPTITV